MTLSAPLAGTAATGRVTAPAQQATEAQDELVQRAQQGDRDAYGALYKTRVDGLSRYVGAILRDVDRTEDVVAQSFMLAWRDLPKLRDPRRFDAWLFRIAHNQAMNEFKRPSTTGLEQTLEPPEPNPAYSPSARMDAQVDSEKLRNALLGLAEDQRDVLVLRFLRGLPHSEVAKQMGRSEQAVRALQYRALQSLRHGF